MTATLAFYEGTGVADGVLAGVSLFFCSAFVILAIFASQSRQEATVSVGKPILEFAALDQNGDRFDLACLRGRPILLKFFRGHW